MLDAVSGDERLVADPREPLSDAVEEKLPDAERARRERARESAGGVVSYATDAAGLVAAFALGGRLFVAGLLSATARELDVEGPVVDPRPDPTARRVAYVSGRTLRVAELDGRNRQLAGPAPDERDDLDVSWGSAEFIAYEEMGRSRGYWWAPDGESLAVARVDTSPVTRWWVSDPAVPARPPNEVAYPAAGTDNALVTLHILGPDGQHVDVRWDRQRFPYLADVTWSAHGPLLATVQARDQRRLLVLEVDPTNGSMTTLAEARDDRWVELVPGVPALLADRRLVSCGDRDGARRLLVDGTVVTPANQQVRAVLHVGDDDVIYVANGLDQPEEQRRCSPTTTYIRRRPTLTPPSWAFVGAEGLEPTTPSL